MAEKLQSPKDSKASSLLIHHDMDKISKLKRDACYEYQDHRANKFRVHAAR